MQEVLLKVYDKINKLKGIINNNIVDNDYLIEKLNKNSTNSEISTSKEIVNKNKKTDINTYNHKTTTTSRKMVINLIIKIIL